MKKNKKIVKFFKSNKNLFRYFLLLFIIVLLILTFIFINYNYKKNYGRVKVERFSYIIDDNYKSFSFEIFEKEKPVFQEVVFDGMTKEQIINQINKSLNSTLSGTAEIFVEKSLEKGIDPYVAVAISLYETGCKWGCSSLVRDCYNLGGLKGSPSCRGTSFKKYDSLEEGIEGYLSIIEYYYKNGMDTPEAMEYKYSGGSTSWASKVNAYIREIKSR